MDGEHTESGEWDAHDDSDCAQHPPLGEQQQHPGWPSVSLDIMATWQARAEAVTGRPIACGHFLPEEAPSETAEAMTAFLGGYPEA